MPALLAQNPDFRPRYSFRRKAFITEAGTAEKRTPSRNNTPIQPREHSPRLQIVIPKPLRSLSRGYQERQEQLQNFENVFQEPIPASGYRAHNHCELNDKTPIGRFLLQRRDKRAKTKILTRQNPSDVIYCQRSDTYASSLTSTVFRCDYDVMAFLQQAQQAK